MKRTMQVGLLAVLAGLMIAAAAQDRGAPLVLPRAFEHRLASAAVGDAYVIQVRLPEKYDPATTRYPVLYVLDGDYWFGAASDIATYLAMVKESPAQIVVGIAYGGTRRDWYRKRARDFTPTARSPESLKQAPLGGHAAEFQRFLAEELIPFVERTYPADPGDRTLAGFSLGGLFALHTVFTRPELFQHYIAIAPAVQWDRRQLFETEAAFHAGSSRLDVVVFSTHGDRDELQDPADWQEFDRLVASRGYLGLRWFSHLFPDETHVSVYPAGLTRGLKTIHAAPPAPAATPEAAILEADAAWAKAVEAKSIDRTMAYYDVEAVSAGSAMFSARGLPAFREHWANLFAQPDFSLTWKVDKVIVTESGTLAYSAGTWRALEPDSSGPYLALWRKQPDGRWKVLIDAAWRAASEAKPAAKP